MVNPFCASVPATDGSPRPGAWIWAPSPTGPRRIARVCFRRVLAMRKAATEAVLVISARTRYRLSVNGVILGVGPGRSRPEHREADSYDLRDYLREGTNIIEVEVLHVSFTTFHHLAEPPGFVAWGNVVTGDGMRHDFATPGDWQCREREGVADHAPRLSFAQGPIEIADLRPERAPAWVAPVPAAAGTAPPPQPRRIPALTRLPLAPLAVRRVPLAGDERMVCVRLVDDGNGPNAVPSRPRLVAARAWVYSPRAQRVGFGSWWGTYWLNGKALDKVVTTRHPLRQTMTADLRDGWNRLHALGEIVFGYCEFCLAWPADARLRVCAVREAAAEDALEVAGPLDADVAAAARAELETDAASGILVWRTQRCDPLHDSPLRRLAWVDSSDAPPAAVTLPVTLAPSRPERLNIDMGRIVLGSIALDLEAPAGTVVDIGHAEQATSEGRPDYGKAVTVYAADRYILPGGRQCVETFDPRGFRHLELRVDPPAGPVTVHAVHAVETRYPYAFEGAFECSDADFTRLWGYGRRTLELCSEDVLTDCPWRERTLYAGDMLAELGVTVGLTRDLRLVRRSIDVLLQSAAPATGWIRPRAPADEDAGLADYPLLTVIASAWLLRLTGDRDFALAAWPALERQAQALAACRGTDGLYTPPVPTFVDHGRRLREGPTAPFNAACVAAWRSFAELARAVGDAAAAAAACARADALEPLLAGAYLDTAAGAFRDLPLAAGGCETEGCPPIVWPLLFAPATRALAPAVLPALRRVLAAFDPACESRSVSPYQMFFLLSLLRALGEAELAETSIRRVYGGMLSAPTGTLWENALPDKSLTHAWSAGICDYFATAVLGVRLGFESADELGAVQIRPCAATLTWARGRVPHPLGNVTVAWERHGGRLRVEVGAPPDVPVEVTPGGPLALLACETTVVRTK